MLPASPRLKRSASPSATAADVDERVLLGRTAKGERAAFEQLYLSYHTRLARFLSRLTPRDDLIEEAINDSFWIVWRKAGEFRGDSMVSTWIMGIAYRCTLKCLRRDGQDFAVVPLTGDERDDSGGEAGHGANGAYASGSQLRQEQRDWIAQGLRHLPPEQRLVIELAYFVGNSCEEIAQITDCPVNTVKARMFQARLKLRNLLPALGGQSASGGV